MEFFARRGDPFPPQLIKQPAESVSRHVCIRSASRDFRVELGREACLVRQPKPDGVSRAFVKGVQSFSQLRIIGSIKRSEGLGSLDPVAGKAWMHAAQAAEFALMIGNSALVLPFGLSDVMAFVRQEKSGDLVHRDSAIREIEAHAGCEHLSARQDQRRAFWFASDDVIRLAVHGFVFVAHPQDGVPYASKH